jgi:glyoxylase-like metal-dependent hydrolase (beta-lactamase superfamily II)
VTSYSITPLVVGANETDQGVMTYLRDYGKRIWIPIFVFLVQGNGHTILVDTGLEDFVVPSSVGEQHNVTILPFEEALAGKGVSPDGVDMIIHTHLHNDHCENDYKCQNAAVYAQKAEFEFFQNPHPIDHRYYPDVLDGVDVKLLEGDAQITDGIKVFLTPGHTVGGQSIAIETKNGTALITGFCCNEKNFPLSGPAVTPGVHIDVRDAYDSIQKVKAMKPDFLLPIHDWAVARMIL